LTGGEGRKRGMVFSYPSRKGKGIRIALQLSIPVTRGKERGEELVGAAYIALK